MRRTWSDISSAASPLGWAGIKNRHRESQRDLAGEGRVQCMVERVKRRIWTQFKCSCSNTALQAPPFCDPINNMKWNTFVYLHAFHFHQFYPSQFCLPTLIFPLPPHWDLALATDLQRLFEYVLFLLHSLLWSKPPSLRGYSEVKSDCLLTGITGWRWKSRKSIRVIKVCPILGRGMGEDKYCWLCVYLFIAKARSGFTGLGDLCLLTQSLFSRVWRIEVRIKLVMTGDWRVLLCVFNWNWNVYAQSNNAHLLIALFLVLFKGKGKKKERKMLKGSFFACMVGRESCFISRFWGILPAMHRI